MAGFDKHANRQYHYFNANDIMPSIIELIEHELGKDLKITEDIIDDAAKYGRDLLEDISPKGTEKERQNRSTYAKSWKVRKSSGKGYSLPSRVIYNTQGQLTHILEHGTAERFTKLGFRRGKGTLRRHIENAYQDTLNYVERLIEERW